MFHIRMQIAGRVDRDTVTARPTMITYDASLPTTHAVYTMLLFSHLFYTCHLVLECNLNI